MRPLLESNLHRRSANVSFSVYAIHMPLLVFLRSGVVSIFVENWLVQPARAMRWLALSGAMSTTIVAGYVFSLGTEAHTSKIRGPLRRFLRRTMPKAAGLPRYARKNRQRWDYRPNSNADLLRNRRRGLPLRSGKG